LFHFLPFLLSSPLSLSLLSPFPDLSLNSFSR
jgi:hypothetical protein